MADTGSSERNGRHKGAVWILDAAPVAVGLLLIFIKIALLAGRVTDGSTFVLVIALAAGVLVALASLVVFAPRTIRLFLLLTVNAVVTTIVLADVLHLRVFGDPAALAQFAYAHQLLPVASSVRQLLRPADALYYLDIVLVLLLSPLYVAGCRRIPPLEPWLRVGVASVALFAGLMVVAPLGRVAGRDGELYRAVSERFSIEAPTDVIGEPHRKKVLEFLWNRRARRDTVSPLFGVARGKNVIILSAESLNAYPLHLAVDGQAIMPNLSAFAKESLHFTAAYDQTGSGRTSDAEFMVLQSLHPVRSGAVAFLYTNTELRALPAILADRRYATVSACGAPGSVWNMAAMHRRLGFQTSYFEDTFRVTERINGTLPDAEFYEQLVPRLAAQRRPFMAFVLSSSNHHPFRLPATHRGLRLGHLEGTELGNYLHSVHYFDEAFGQLVHRLRITGLLDESVVVVYGDHQGYLSDHAALASLLRLPSSRHEDVWLEQKRVPLVIRLPGGAHAGERADVAVTVGGGRAPSTSADGVDGKYANP